MPAPPYTFVNRHWELNRLDSLASAPPGPHARVVVISGMAGVGKTALCRHWAQSNRDRYSDGLLYADFTRGSVETGDLLGMFLRALGVPNDRIPVGYAERGALFQSLAAGKRLLILLDDVEFAEQAIPLIPPGPESVVLITTRAPPAQLISQGADLLTLTPLEEAAARELLTILVGRNRAEAEPEAVGAMTRISAGLPLALQISSRHLTMGDDPWTVRRLVAEITHEAQSGRIPVEAGSSVDLVFTGAYRTLSPPAATLYRRLAMHPGPSFTPVLARVAADRPPHQVNELMGELAALHLIEDRGEWWRFHGPLRRHALGALAQDEPGEEREAAANRLVSFYTDAAVQLGVALDPQGHHGDSPSYEWREELPLQSQEEALDWFGSERSNLFAVLEAATERHGYGQAWETGEALRLPYGNRGRYRDALMIYALAAAAARHSGDATTEARIRFNLARAQADLDDPERAVHELDAVSAIAGHLEMPTGFPTAVLPSLEAQVVVEPYTASGGASALLHTAGESTLRVEAHQGSFALVWPTYCSLSELTEIVAIPPDSHPDADTVVLLTNREGAVQETTFADAQGDIGGEDIEFARLELTDVVVTWNRTADPALTENGAFVHEIGLGAEHFDPQYLNQLLAQTAVEEISSAATTLVEKAKDVLANTPHGSLRDAEAADS